MFRAPIQRRSSGGPDKQAEIWRSVGETQRLLAGNLAAPVASDKSRTSLQLTLESERLKAAQAAFVTALETPVGETGDAVGVVIAVNGRIASAEIYLSHALFAKMWPKLLRAGVTEALASRPTGAVTAPPVAAVEQFLRDAETGKASERAVATFARTETRTSTGALRVEARKADGAWVHRSYLAK